MIDIYAQTWWHGSRTPLTSIDYTHVQGGLHLGTKPVATQFGPHLKKFSLRDRLNVQKGKDTGEGWLKRAKAARAKGKDVIVYLNRIEGIEPALFDDHDHNRLNSMTDSAFLKLFPQATYSLLVLRDGVIT